MSLPAATIGLGVFLAVVTSLFALFISAYFMRMHVADWCDCPRRAVWLTRVCWSWAVSHCNTRRLRHAGDDRRRQDGLIVGGLFALTFLVGQLLAWRQLNAAGYFLAANPGNAFFYLFTGLHGLHLLGGLVALGWTADKVWRGFEVKTKCA